jgi:hypothetical protein
MRARALVVICSLAASLGLDSAVRADQPIDGLRLTLKRSGTKQKLLFLSDDPDAYSPLPGGNDDPVTGSPGGATLELFSQHEGPGSVTAPRGAGKPGWTTATDIYRFANASAPGGISPVQSIILRKGKLLKVVARATGLPLAVAEGTIGVRFTTGGLRSCALFGPSTIRHDKPGSYVATHASAATLTNCSNTSLGGPTCGENPYPQCDGTCAGGAVCGLNFTLDGCRCVSPTEPCGDTFGVCNGTCPAGEQCGSVGGFPLPSCGCVPVGATPCGATGVPTCGGDCPGADVCRPIAIQSIFGGLGCMCVHDAPCDNACGGGNCPGGFFCARIPQQGCTCAPFLCTGGAGFPTCDGSCGGGTTCQPFSVPNVVDYCVCAP